MYPYDRGGKCDIISSVMIRETIRQTILENKLIDPGEHIVLGLSGGPDSVCLFHILRQLQQDMNFVLYAVHVNHGFRPGAADKDQAYVEELCRKEEVTCIPFVCDCRAMAEEQGLSSEEAGRKARYDAFRRVAQSLIYNGVPRNRVKIAVAQNADDQAETVLLRLLRGTGPDGLSGMAYKRRDGEFLVIRPLLDVWRRDIEVYCREQGLEPRIDHTNLQPVYTRNKIRLQLLPYLREHFNPEISHALVRLSKIAGQDREYLWTCADEAYGNLLQKDGSLEQEGLKNLPEAVRHRVFMKGFQEAGLASDLAAVHLFAADRMLASEKASGKLDMPGGYRMALQYGRVRFYKVQKEEKQEDTRRLRAFVKESGRGDYPAGAAVFDWEKLCRQHCGTPEICLRTRRPGDYIRLRGGRKKLQNFFVDVKVPKEERDQVIFAATGSEILWIPADSKRGLGKDRYAEKYKLDETTKKALVLEIICET